MVNLKSTVRRAPSPCLTLFYHFLPYSFTHQSQSFTFVWNVLSQTSPLRQWGCLIREASSTITWRWCPLFCHSPSAHPTRSSLGHLLPPEMYVLYMTLLSVLCGCCLSPVLECKPPTESRAWVVFLRPGSCEVPSEQLSSSASW